MSAPAFLPPVAEETVTIEEACRRLACIGRSTFYRIPFFETRRVPISGGRIGIRVSDINLYLRLQAEKARTPRRRGR